MPPAVCPDHAQLRHKGARDIAPCVPYSTGERPKFTLSEVVPGADERPISFDDKSIMFIRLTFANADDDFEWNASVTSPSAEQQHVLNLCVPSGTEQPV